MPVVHYDWDELEDNIVEEYDDGGNTIVEYTTKPELYGDVISQHRDGQSHFFHHDGIGNTTEVTDINGNVTDTRQYTAFGEITESTGTTEFPFQFIGQKGYYRDEETERYSVRRREYEPIIAGWMSADPMGDVGGTNAYSYSNNRPTSLDDPSGLSVWLRGTFVEQQTLLRLLNQLCPAGAWALAASGELKPGNTTCGVTAIGKVFCQSGMMAPGAYMTTYRANCRGVANPISCCCVCDAINALTSYELYMRTKAGGSTYGGGLYWALAGIDIYIGPPRPLGYTGAGDPGFGIPGRVRTPHFLLLAHELCGHGVSGLGQVQGVRRQLVWTFSDN